MRWVIDFDGDLQDVTVTTVGEATAEGFARLNSELVQDERFRPGMLVLVDHTHLVVDRLDSDEVRRIATDFVERRAELQTTVLALVVPKPLQFGLARMSVNLADAATSSVRVFSTRPEASIWLQQVRDFGPDAAG